MSETSLFEDLRSADPAVRYSVLSRIENRPWTPAQVAEFRDLVRSEADVDTRFHMELVLRLKDRSQEASARATLADVEAVLSVTPTDYFKLALLLQHLDPAHAPLVVDLLREKQWHEFPGEVLPFVLRLMKKHGTPQDLPAIETLCRHSHPRVLQAAVEALEKLNPDDLKSFIVPLLVNASSGIQSLAIRLLHRWDAAAARAHFEAMLFDEERAVRETALVHAYFFPFAEIEELMLRFLGVEQDDELLRKASRLFIINPTFATVERLSELYETATKSRKEL
ncbi:MAG TPA: HEAT repeat domain-containing protein, partial [Candidatus Ozemobacteraceae bacterium]|nr:HEAT repeat domain-containing protein [Candidatus Ozemobacteraceae bacterium]